MPAGKDFQLEETIRRSMEILQEVEGYDPHSPVSAAEGVSGQAADRELDTLQQEQAPQAAHVEVALARDLMSATVSFTPPAADQPPLTESDVLSALQAKGVNFGVDPQAIRKALQAVNAELAAIGGVIVARGKAPRNQTPAYLQLSPTLAAAPPPPDLEAASVDFKARSPFRLVRTGDVLARRVPEQEGEIGFNVRGEAIPFGKVEVSTLEPGANTGFTDEALVALRDGHFELRGDTLTVHEVLDVNGDVDYRTGHVDFPGDVIIHGEVKQGFRVKAEGSVFCARVIDATLLECQGDLVTQQGILGRGSGSVRVGGSLTARFIENCLVEAQGEIRVRTGCLNSVLRTVDKVLTGSKGMLVGGRISAQEGIQAWQVGSPTSPRTELVCGINPFVQQKLQWIRDKNLALATRLRLVQARQAAQPASKARLQEVHDRLRAAIHKLNAAAQELMKELEKNDKAFVQVQGQIYPGSYIEICHIPFVVTESLAALRFSLDKRMGKIVLDPLL
jgi:uncharacterized protein (DUF342 family)